MPITVNATRPKATTQETIPLQLAVGSVVSQGNSFFIPINATNLTIPDFTIAGVSATAGSDVLTSENGFAEVGVGDAIAAGTNIGAAVVVEKIDNNKIKISVAATGTGTENLTFTPGGENVIDLTLCGVEVAIAAGVDSGKLTMVVTGLSFDGNLKGVEGTPENASRKINLNRFDIDLDSVLATAKIPRTN